MTVRQLLAAGNLNLTKKQRQRLGHLISEKAKLRNVDIKRVEETIEVNDYPDEFVEEMQQTSIDYIVHLNSITNG